MTTDTTVETATTTTIHPESLEAIQLITSTDATVAKKLPQTKQCPNKIKDWHDISNTVKIDDATGHITLLDLGAGGRIRKLPAEAFNKLPKLKTLNLGGTDLPIDSIIAVLRACPSLEHVYLGGNGIGSAGMKQLCEQVLMRNNIIEKLDVRYNDIGPDGCEALADLVFLSSSNCSSSCGTRCSCIRHLYLEGNDIGDRGAVALAKALKCYDQCKIQELFLGANKIGSTGAKALAESLGGVASSKLEKLYLEGNSIGPEGAKAFEGALNRLYAGNDGEASLKKLFVDNNGIGKEGSEALGRALRSDSMIGSIM